MLLTLTRFQVVPASLTTHSGKKIVGPPCAYHDRMPLPLRAPAGALIALAITAAATACSSGAQSAQPVETDRAVAAGSTASPPDRRATVAPPTLPPLPIEDGGPLTALPECQPSPQPVQDSVPGLVLPDGAVITSV